MNAYKFIREDGSELVYTTSMPGLMIVPSGQTSSDAIHITHEEYKDHEKKVKKIGEGVKSRDLAAELDSLLLEHTKLKAEMATVKANAKNPQSS